MDKPWIGINITKAQMDKIRKDGRKARKQMAKESGCTPEQIERGLYRICDAILGTKTTTRWN